MTVHRFTAIPLTPIHIGDGTVLGPEDYRLVDDRLERFAPTAVLRDMLPPARKACLDALDRGNLQTAWKLLRESVRPEHVVDRIAVGPAARQEIRALFEGEQRKGEIRPVLRSAGRALIPGSSLKGAIRTAVLSALAPGHRSDIEAATRSNPPPRTGPASDALQCAVLGHTNTDQDPFRFVKVGDIALPEGATRIDRVVNWRPAALSKNDRQPADKMQMIFERLRAACDGAECPSGAVLLTVDAEAPRRAAQLARAKAPSLELAADQLWRAVNAFHWQLLDDEDERFYAGEPAIRAALDAAFRVRLPDGRLVERAAIRQHPDLVLLRVGRFGQFESKSVAGFRAGWNAQAKSPRSMTQGNTRNLARLTDGGDLVPFGWLLLAPPGSRAEPSARATAGAAHGAAPAVAPARARRYLLDGEPVVVISRDGDRWMVRLPSGDIEEVDPTELTEQP